MNQSRKEISSISKEQTELLRIENELKKALHKVNENLNQLLVEELQLKSFDIEMNVTNRQSPSKSHKPESYSPQKSKEMKHSVDAASSINKIDLNLDVKGIFQRHLEEMEEDEDN